MAQKNRKCLACGEKFSYCPSCSRVDALKPSWSSEFCGENCMTLWTTLTKFGMGRIEKSEAKEIISALGLKPIDSYVDCVKRDYNKVMEETKKPKRGKRIEIKPIDDAMDVEPTIVEEILFNIEQSHEVVTIEEENNKAL